MSEAMKKDCRDYRPLPDWLPSDEDWYYGRPCENCSVPIVLHWIPFDDEVAGEF